MEGLGQVSVQVIWVEAALGNVLRQGVELLNVSRPAADSRDVFRGKFFDTHGVTRWGIMPPSSGDATAPDNRYNRAVRAASSVGSDANQRAPWLCNSRTALILFLAALLWLPSYGLALIVLSLRQLVSQESGPGTG